MRLALPIVLYVTTASAQWERYAGTAKGDWTDNPPPHPLSYFMANACVEPGHYDRIGDCSTYKTTTNLRLIGHVGQFIIFNLRYSPLNPDQSTALSVLVESTDDVLHEIYFREDTQVDAASRPTDIVLADGQTLAVEHYDSGGHPGDRVEHFFSFGDYGAKLMHPERIREAAQKPVPRDSGISPLTSTINYDNLTWVFYVGPADPWRHPEPGSSGTIVVNFKIENGDFAPKSAQFVPSTRRE